MRFLLALVCFVALAQMHPFPGPGRAAVGGGGGGGTPAWVQDDGATYDPFNTSRSVTFTSSTTSGNAIIGVYSGSETLTCSDNKGNSYATVNSTGDGGQHCIAHNITGGASHSVTFTISSSNPNAGNIIIFEVSNLATSSAFDQSCTGAYGFQANINCTTGTTTVANEFILGTGYFNVSATAGSGFTLRHTQGNTYTATKVVSSIGTQNISFTNSEQNCGLTGSTFKGN